LTAIAAFVDGCFAAEAEVVDPVEPVISSVERFERDPELGVG